MPLKASIPSPFPHPDTLILAGVTLRQLRLFGALADHGQMQRAAEHLHISQPAASKLLAQLETVVGAQLFERRPRGLVLNLFGESLLRHAQAILTEIGLAAEELSDLRNGRGGRVAVGSVMAPAVETIATAVNELRRELPRLNITFEVEPSETLVARLLAHDLDFVIARLPASVDSTLLEYEELSDEQAGLLVQKDHPLLKVPKFSLSMTMAYPWLVQHRGSLLRRGAEAMLLRNGLTISNQIIESDSFLATVVLLSVSEAIAPMSLPVSELMMQMGRFKLLELPEPFLLEPYGIIRVRGRTLSPTVKAFYERLKQRFLDKNRETKPIKPTSRKSHS